MDKLTSAQDLFKQANRLLDELWFEEAIATYKQSISLGGPESSDGLANLTIAQSLAYLDYARSLVLHYPDSIAAQLFRIRAGIKHGLTKHAVELCTKIISRTELTPEAKSQFVSQRLSAAIKAGVVEYLKDDFLLIWQSLESIKGRNKLLQDVLSITEANFEPVFTELAQDIRFSATIRQIFAQKANYLALLSNLNDTDFATS